MKRLLPGEGVLPPTIRIGHTPAAAFQREAAALRFPGPRGQARHPDQDRQQQCRHDPAVRPFCRSVLLYPHLVPSPFSAVYAIVEENSLRDVPRVHKKTLSHLAKGRTPVFFNPFICPAGRDGQ